MNKFLDRLTSIRLAIWLLSYLLVGSILATLIPQGLADAEYYTIYPKLVAQLVVQTGFKGFFGSIIFIIPVLVFFANLSACTVKRFIRELKKRGTHHHGPDILHIGLILLVLGSLWSYSGHQEGSVTLAPGDSVNLPDGSVMSLVDFTYERYEDGRPADWTSIIDVKKDGKTMVDKAEVRVNKPLRYAGFTFYQASYSELPSLALADKDGREVILAQGEERVFGTTSYFFMAPESQAAAGMPGATPPGMPGTPTGGLSAAASQTGTAGQSDKAILSVTSAMGEAKTLRAAPGDQVGDFTVIGIKAQLATGIQAVDDPGYPLVFVAFLLIALGTAVTFIQKIKEGV
ncbi:MAG: cytochrome c biogenesis protein ResB [Spirochaetia bacterium]|nr:cytochrome c biogenesis protein ResB [Spirochaetia bacterium]